MSEWHPEDGSTFDEFENPIWRHRFLKDATPEHLLKIRDEFARGNWSVFGFFARAILEGKLKPEIPNTDYIPPPKPVERNDDYPQPVLVKRNDIPQTVLTKPNDDPQPVPAKKQSVLSKIFGMSQKAPPPAPKLPKEEPEETRIPGEKTPEPKPSKLPHAVFWADFLKRASEAERREFLEFLLRAQMAHRPIKDRQMRWKPSGFTPACRKALLDYLNAFETPCHVPDPMTLTGGRILHYGHIPDERMVHLAGIFGLAEALPALEKLLKMRRRLFQLHTDYPTGPKYVDSLISECVLAVVRIGLAGDRQKAVAVLNSAKLKGKETVWFEIFSDNRGRSSRYVREETLEEIGMPGRNDLLKTGIAALEKDGEERRSLEWPIGKYPRYPWVLQETEGAGCIRDGKLYYQSTSMTNIIDLASGRTIVRFNTGQTNSNQGVACYNQITALDAAGDFVMVTQIIPLAEGNGRHWEAVTFDHENGEVKRTFELAVQPERAYGPVVWPQSDGGIVFHYERKVWKQSADGKLVWKHETSEQETVRCTGDVVGILTKKDFCLRRTPDFTPILDLDLKVFHDEVKGDYREPPEMREELILLEDRFYVFPRWEGPILAYDFNGKLLWKKKPEKGGYWLGYPRTLGKGLFGNIYDYMYMVSENGDLKWFDRPSGMKDMFLSNSRGVFMKTDSAILYRAFEANETRTTLPDFPHISEMVCLDEDWLVLNFYDRERYLACLPRKEW